MLLGVISCSLRSARHGYRRQLVEVAANDVPITFSRPTSGRSRECHAARQRHGGRRRPHNHCSRRRSEADFLGRVRLGEGCQGRSHGSFSRAIYRTGLYVCRNGAPLWTTSTILRIRTAARLFLTKAVEPSRQDVSRAPTFAPRMRSDAEASLNPHVEKLQ
jgi:hypothetical protein